MTPTQPLAAAADWAKAARAPATQRAYDSDWRHFSDWCARAALPALPATPAIIGEYLAAQAVALKPATLVRRVSAIVVRHRQHGYRLDRDAPEIAEVMAGIRRTVGVAPAQKDVLTTEEIKAITAALPASLTGLRDRAVLLLGFAGAFRRSELAGLHRRDLAWTSEGVVVTLRRSKEDQEQAGGLKAIPHGGSPTSCPVHAVRQWLVAARLDEGPLFRAIDRHGNLREAGLSGEAVAAIVKRAVRTWVTASGGSPREAQVRADAVAGHSLRAGMITCAARAGASDYAIMATSLHKSRRSLQGYVRRGHLFDDTAIAHLDL